MSAGLVERYVEYGFFGLAALYSDGFVGGNGIIPVCQSSGDIDNHT